MKPAGPCFEVGPRGYFAFEPEFSSTQSASALGVIQGFFEKLVVFDQDGRKWNAAGVEAPFKKNWWRVLLANTVYNPRVSISVQWRQPEMYAIEELKRAYVGAVESDDDILTQFVEGDELKQRIAEAKNFDDLVEVYRWMQTDSPNEEE